MTERIITSNVRDLIVLTSYKSNIEENDGKMEKLVLKAVTNLISSLKIDLEGLFVPTIEASLGHSLIENESDALVVEVEVEDHELSSQNRVTRIATAESVSESFPLSPPPPLPPLYSRPSPTTSTTTTSPSTITSSSSSSSSVSSIIPPSPSSQSVLPTPPTPPTSPATTTSATSPDSTTSTTSTIKSTVSSSFNIPLESTRERSNPPSSSSSAVSKSKIDGNSDLNQVDLQSAYTALQSAAKSLTPPMSSSSSSSFKNDGKFIDVGDNMEVSEWKRESMSHIDLLLFIIISNYYFLQQ